MTTDTTAPEVDAGLVDVEGIVFVRTGWVRVTIDERLYRLRRPLFGELKKLRTALEDVTDLINERSTEATARAAEMVAEQERVNAKDRPTKKELEGLDEMRLESKQLGRNLVEFADDQRLGWWQLVFATLGVGDGKADSPTVPEDWPAWVVDVNLPHAIMQHWRSAPLAPGR